MSGNFKEFCSKWDIRLIPSTPRYPQGNTPRYPQGNGQAESSNKLIIDSIKKRQDVKKGHRADELDIVLWSHRTTPRGSTKSTPFSLAYGVEAIAPAEVNVTSLQRSKMPQYVELNKEMMLDALDEIEERRDQALLRIPNYQHQIESYYNKKVWARPVELGDLVMRKVFENTKELNALATFLLVERLNLKKTKKNRVDAPPRSLPLNRVDAPPQSLLLNQVNALQTATFTRVKRTTNGLILNRST